jgi:hypothetical protein
MNDIYLLELMAGVIAAVVMLIFEVFWPWVAIVGGLGTLCAMSFTRGWEMRKKR